MPLDKIDRWVLKHSSLVQVVSLLSWIVVTITGIFLAAVSSDWYAMLGVPWGVGTVCAWWWVYQGEEQDWKERSGGYKG